MLIIGIGFTQPTGFYAFQLFDDYSLGLPLLFIAFFQVVAVSWVYGNDKYVFIISLFISTLSHKIPQYNSRVVQYFALVSSSLFITKTNKISKIYSGGPSS